VWETWLECKQKKRKRNVLHPYVANRVMQMSIVRLELTEAGTTDSGSTDQGPRTLRPTTGRPYHPGTTLMW